MDKTDNSTLCKVQLQADTYMVCLQHALSTENFEVMGLLIGDYEDRIVKISSAIILRRSDKKKDRVEISTEQLYLASSEAEELTKKLKRPMRVMGWYHSHPHITVFPSHVDVRTQAMYQQMDRNFVGLIFSVFMGGKDSKAQEMHLICFQSRNEQRREIPLEIVYTPSLSDNCLKTMTDLPKILVQEEEDTAAECGKHPDIITQIHNDAVKTQAMSHITDIICKPLLQTFEHRIAFNKQRAQYLQKHLKTLKSLDL